ncbi:MAG: TIGR01777 family protein [Halobacteriovorax sp.]|nr:TIGR01777 family protein [Halobacteriovorax sp.]|tara:strand:- start:194992 stop:196365 length:1374 start_codon:yes stop_codon:yes gene_type:complete
MKILVTGATGFVGKYVLKELAYRGHDIVVTTRNPEKAKKNIDLPHDAFKWDPMTEALPMEALEGVDSVIHLLGENIAAGRWTKTLKDKIYYSRVTGTKNLVETLNKSSATTLVSASAVGFYERNVGDKELTEDSPKGEGWLAKVCHDWEQEALAAKEKRTCIFRIGVVLGSDGGAMDKMLFPFKMGVGGNLGNGNQWMSWVHVKDLATMLVKAAEDSTYEGFYNATAPHSVTNATFTKTLGRILSRPTLFPVPSFVLKTLFGDMSTILLDSQKVVPRRLEEKGFKFEFSTLPEALEDVCHKRKLPPGDKKVVHQKLEKAQWLPDDRKKVFSFFCKPENLEEITPKWMNFKILRSSTPEIQEGTEFDYKLRVRGLPIKWKTIIKKWTPDEEFIDWQKRGPYETWYHTHKFTPYKGGTLMEDIVYYKVPGGFLGELILGPIIKRDIEKIFAYRKQKIAS